MRVFKVLLVVPLLFFIGASLCVMMLFYPIILVYMYSRRGLTKRTMEEYEGELARPGL